MAFTTNLTGTTQIDDSIVLAYAQSFLVATGQEQILDQFVSMKMDIGAKSITMPKYPRLGLATTPLDEVEDVTSVALSDTGITLRRALLSSLFF